MEPGILGPIPGLGQGKSNIRTSCARKQGSTPRIMTPSKKDKESFPGGAVVENLPANAGNTGSSPGLGRSHKPRTE